MCHNRDNEHGSKTIGQHNQRIGKQTISNNVILILTFGLVKGIMPSSDSMGVRVSHLRIRFTFVLLFESPDVHQVASTFHRCLQQENALLLQITGDVPKAPSKRTFSGDSGKEAQNI